MKRADILLVEDEKQMQDLVSQVLRDAGYGLLTAVNSEVALMFLREPEVPIDLLLTDIVVPGELDGFALAREATTLRPGIKVIYMTGYAGVAKIRSQGAPFGEILPKPWRVEDLLKTVDLALKISN
jgi:DNA-binding NtrC family response regulator